ncbi:MAG: type 1 glutamine amidotransferase [Microcella sp.]|uniref:type 1 glutamine amidotransferase n=1 Tax=Microcella sp. TaxID=1913979 RepID=UPI0024CD3191|nr:type 1 glutamine amidotransferase [Microcella sp.]UYN84831.1 MAG: type 1 glutamine amidotransferase [Microcella sp.]
MRVLFIQHDHVSPLGPVGERFAQLGFDIDTHLVVPEESFSSPNVATEFPDRGDYDVLVPLGAPWGAWDDACIGRWLLPEISWLRDAVSGGMPVLGICFGGQLVARAMGGSVSPAPRAEIGWTSIWSDQPSLVGNGPWFQFHYDRWAVPPGAVELARTPAASQAFTIESTLAVQFHPELDAAGLQGWLDWGGASKIREAGLDPDIMLAETVATADAARDRTYALVDAFLTEVAGLLPR